MQKLFFRTVPTPGSTLLDGGLALNCFFGDVNVAFQVRGYSGVSIATPQAAGCGSINILNYQALNSFHTGGAHVLRGDGSVVFLSENISSIVLAALVTRNGGEKFSLE